MLILAWKCEFCAREICLKSVEICASNKQMCCGANYWHGYMYTTNPVLEPICSWSTQQQRKLHHWVALLVPLWQGRLKCARILEEFEYWTEQKKRTWRSQARLLLGYYGNCHTRSTDHAHCLNVHRRTRVSEPTRWTHRCSFVRQVLWLSLTVGFRREEDWLSFETLVLCLVLLLFYYKELTMSFGLRSILLVFNTAPPYGGHFCLGASFPAIVRRKVVDAPLVWYASTNAWKQSVWCRKPDQNHPASATIFASCKTLS